MLCLSLIILSHQTVAYGCAWCSRTLLLAISEQSSLTYTPSNTRALPYTTLNAHPHTHPPHSIHTHTSKFHHSQNSQIIPSTHTQIYLHLAHPMAAPFTGSSQIFKDGNKPTLPTCCMLEHTYPLMFSEQHFLIFLSSQHQQWT